MVDLWEAHRVALERNKHINETGRLTELLEKYSKANAGRAKMPNARSITKGASRIATSVAASLGFASEVPLLSELMFLHRDVFCQMFYSDRCFLHRLHI
jgi:hypothetical protein